MEYKPKDKKVKVDVYLTLYKSTEVSLKENYTAKDLEDITKSILNLKVGEKLDDWKVDDIYVRQQ